jgi:GAF domain-containing protein
MDRLEKNVNEEGMVVQESVSSLEELQVWRQRLVRGLLRAAIIVGAVALAPGFYSAYKYGDISTLPLYVGVYVVVVLFAFWRRAPYALQTWIFLGLLYVTGIAAMPRRGLSGADEIFLLAVPTLAVIFFGRREGVLGLAFTILTLVASAWAFSTGRIVVPVENQITTAVLDEWLVVIVDFLLVGTLLMISGDYLVPRLAAALTHSRRLTRELEAYRVQLEERVAERTSELTARTQDLETANIELEEARRYQEAVNRQLEEASERTRRRATQLQAVAEVGRAIAQVRDLQRLLPQVTRLISQHFGYYHVGIFLIDEASRYAVLRAANSPGGQKMLARGHKLPVGTKGVVGYVTGTGQPRVVLDVGIDAIHVATAELPDTRSEMTLPLRTGGQIIGALDVQSFEAEAFDQEDVDVLSTLADQVAIAIHNARMFRQSQEALAEAEKSQRRYLQRAWADFLQQRSGLQFEYTLEGAPPAVDTELPAAKQALEQGKSVAVADAASDGDDALSHAVLSVPVKLHGQVIGVIELHETDEARTWTDHEIALAQAVADQMAQASETARLSEQTQARAEREQLVSQITARMTGAASVQAILQVGSEELGKALGVSRSVVRLCTQQDSTQADTVIR